jgi:ASC-1-like (ASCH) protein
MKAPFDFVIEPKGNRYNNTTKVGDKDLILNTEVYNHQFVNREAIVKSVPTAFKTDIIQAGQKAVEELIKVAKEPIVDSDDDISADRLKNAAATKKLAIFDAFEILNRIQEEENLLEGKAPEEAEKKVFKGFAEGRSK